MTINNAIDINVCSRNFPTNLNMTVDVLLFESGKLFFFIESEHYSQLEVKLP
jgi:hypothetical protein